MKKNIVANIFGRLWGLLSSFLFIPLYIKILGFESYSVISYTLMLAGIMAILDGGLTATLSREFARADNSEDDKKKIYNTLETVYSIIITLCILLVIFFSDNISKSLHVKTYTHEQLSLFLKIVSIDIGFQLFFRFYMGGLLGMEKQVKANTYQIIWGIARNACVLILVYFYPSLTLFFIWQSITTFLFTLIIKYEVDRMVFRQNIFNLKFTFEKDIFNKVKKFAGGMMLISLVAAINTQMDKITISKYMSIESLGYYTLAVSLSSALLVIVNPLATAVLPKFTSLYSEKSRKEAALLFNKFSMLASILIFTLLSLYIYFSKDILWAWTGDLNLAEKAYKIVPVIGGAYALIALQVIPYHVSIANGYTKLNNLMGVISVLITFPGYMYGIKYYGALGAAWVFFAVQFFTFIIYLYFINKKFINENFFNNLIFKQVVLPALVAFTISYLLSLIQFTNNRIALVFWLLIVFIIVLFVSLLCNIPRKEIISSIDIFKQKMRKKQ